MQRVAAYRAELWRFVRAHPAVLHAAVDAFKAVAGTFKQSDLGVDCIRVPAFRRWYGCARFYHVFPFAFEVVQGGDVGFPRFHVVRIHGDLLEFVCVLVGQSAEAVPELMHDNRLEHGMAGH